MTTQYRLKNNGEIYKLLGIDENDDYILEYFCDYDDCDDVVILNNLLKI